MKSIRSMISVFFAALILMGLSSGCVVGFFVGCNSDFDCGFDQFCDFDGLCVTVVFVNPTNVCMIDETCNLQALPLESETDDAQP